MADDAEWLALCDLMGQPELQADNRFLDLPSRRRNHDALDDIISAWTTERDRYDLMHALQGVGIASGPVLTGKDVHFDPHYRERGFLERVDYPPERGMGSRPFIGRPYKFSKSNLRIHGPSPTFGQHNGPILQELLGVDEEDYRQLVQEAIVATVPLTGEASPRAAELQALERGTLAAWDPDYRQRLGL